MRDGGVDKVERLDRKKRDCSRRRTVSRFDAGQSWPGRVGLLTHDDEVLVFNIGDEDGKKLGRFRRARVLADPMMRAGLFCPALACMVFAPGRCQPGCELSRTERIQQQMPSHGDGQASCAWCLIN